MDNLFVVSCNSRIIGVYTSHRKAVQAIITETLPFGYTMNDYTYEFKVEFYTFTDGKNPEKVYELQEVTPNVRA